MDLNTIRLSPYQLAGLYRDSLVTTDETMVALTGKETSPALKPASKPLGNNQRNILIVVHYADAVHLPDDTLSFLINMLSACNLSLDDVAIINRHDNPSATYRPAVDLYKSRIVLLFDTDPVGFGLPIDFPQFQVQSFSNATYLFAPSLEECRDDKIIKSKLWVSLRRLFGV